MAWPVDKYVSDSGTEPWATNSSSNPSSLAEALANVAAGERVQVLGGSYTATSVTYATVATAADPIAFIGVTAFDDLTPPARDANGDLDMTGYPVITVATAAFASTTASKYHFWQGITFTGAINADEIVDLSGSFQIMHRCRAEQLTTGTSTASRAIAYGAQVLVLDCDVYSTADFTATSAVTGGALVATSDSAAGAFFNKVICEPASSGRGVCAYFRAAPHGHNVLINRSGPCLNMNIGSVAVCDTMYGDGTGDYGIQYGITNATWIFVIACHFSDFDTAWIRKSSSVNDLRVWTFNSRTRDVTADSSSAGGTISIFDRDRVTTDTGGAATDYADEANNNLALIAAAPGKQGAPFGVDIGALRSADAAGGGGDSVVHASRVVGHRERRRAGRTLRPSAPGFTVSGGPTGGPAPMRIVHGRARASRAPLARPQQAIVVSVSSMAQRLTVVQPRCSRTRAPLAARYAAPGAEPAAPSGSPARCVVVPGRAPRGRRGSSTKISTPSLQVTLIGGTVPARSSVVFTARSKSRRR